jgi:hypothetical protein
MYYRWLYFHFVFLFNKKLRCRILTRDFQSVVWWQGRVTLQRYIFLPQIDSKYSQLHLLTNEIKMLLSAARYTDQSAVVRTRNC